MTNITNPTIEPLEVDDCRGGVCPECKLAHLFNLGAAHWYACDTHRYCWPLGREMNCFLRTESVDTWKSNYLKYRDYTIIGLCRGKAGRNTQQVLWDDLVDAIDSSGTPEEKEWVKTTVERHNHEMEPRIRELRAESLFAGDGCAMTIEEARHIAFSESLETILGKLRYEAVRDGEIVDLLAEGDPALADWLENTVDRQQRDIYSEFEQTPKGALYLFANNLNSDHYACGICGAGISLYGGWVIMSAHGDVCEECVKEVYGPALLKELKRVNKAGEYGNSGWTVAAARMAIGINRQLADQKWIAEKIDARHVAMKQAALDASLVAAN